MEAMEMAKTCTHFPYSDNFFQTSFKPMSLAQASAKARSEKPCPSLTTRHQYFHMLYGALSAWQD